MSEYHWNISLVVKTPCTGALRWNLPEVGQGWGEKPVCRGQHRWARWGAGVAQPHQPCWRPTERKSVRSSAQTPKRGRPSTVFSDKGDVLQEHWCFIIIYCCIKTERREGGIPEELVPGFSNMQAEKIKWKLAAQPPQTYLNFLKG